MTDKWYLHQKFSKLNLTCISNNFFSRFSDTLLSVGEMNSLAFESHPVPLKYAVVDGKDISFYSMLDVQLPAHTES